MVKALSRLELNVKAEISFKRIDSAAAGAGTETVVAPEPEVPDRKSKKKPDKTDKKDDNDLGKVTYDMKFDLGSLSHNAPPVLEPPAPPPAPEPKPTGRGGRKRKE